MILVTFRNSFNALNKIIIYRRGRSPVCVHVTLLYLTLRAVLIQPTHSISHTNTGCSAEIFPSAPSTFIATSSAGLFQGSLPWLLPFLNSPFSFPPFIGSFKLNVYMLITLKVSSFSGILIHPHLKSYSSHVGIFALLGSGILRSVGW